MKNRWVAHSSKPSSARLCVFLCSEVSHVGTVYVDPRTGFGFKLFCSVYFPGGHSLELWLVQEMRARKTIRRVANGKERSWGRATRARLPERASGGSGVSLVWSHLSEPRSYRPPSRLSRLRIHPPSTPGQGAASARASIGRPANSHGGEIVDGGEWGRAPPAGGPPALDPHLQQAGGQSRARSHSLESQRARCHVYP